MGMIKTSKEIKLLRKSASITNSCIKIIKDSLKEEITEIELRRRIRKNIRKQRASQAFQTLIACGKRTAMVHPKPYATNRIITGLGYVDFGASYKGYKTDITVPFIKGAISKKERKIIDTTLNAYKISVSTVKLDKFCWESFEIVNNYLKKNKFSMKHALGHGLGLKVHEWPLLIMPSKKLTEKGRKKWEKIKKVKYEENMVIAIEPGIYVKGVGGCRIENDFLLTKKGPVALTKAELIKV